jgi:hypothetical protein
VSKVATAERTVAVIRTSEIVSGDLSPRTPLPAEAGLGAGASTRNHVINGVRGAPESAARRPRESAIELDPGRQGSAETVSSISRSNTTWWCGWARHMSTRGPTARRWVAAPARWCRRQGLPACDCAA